MLRSHIDAIENHLLAISKIPANAGHSLHKGTPREAFIKEFLSGHLGENLAIGTGEIIDAASRPNKSRNQIDIVVYKRDYPKLDLGGGINAFLAESVLATIEVKSTLTKSELAKSIRTAQTVKSLERHVQRVFHAGYQPPSILSYVVAYNGPFKLETMAKWITLGHSSAGIVFPNMELSQAKREKLPSPALDAVFVLGKGSAYFDNTPIGYLTDEDRQQYPGAPWVAIDAPCSNLLLLFVFLMAAVAGFSGSWLNPLPYLASTGQPGSRILVFP